MIAVFILIDGDKPPLARADGCQGCSSNSPIINPFPIMWLRSGTSRVIKGSHTCRLNDDDHASIGINRIEPSTPDHAANGEVRGYQLVVLDKAKNTICKGSEVTGIVFELSEGKEWVLIQQVAKTRITPDPLQINRRQLNEYRLVYYLSDIKQPEHSLCTHDIHGAGRFRRLWRRLSGYKGPNLPPPRTSSKLTALSEIFPDHLIEYAVIIPDAEYDNHGNPWIPPVNLEPIGQLGYRNKGQVSLEWFELACTGGALAHTDLSGVVEIGEPKWVRTAALRMFLAQYHNRKSDTLHGVPIQFTRDIPYPELKTIATTQAETHPGLNGELSSVSLQQLTSPCGYPTTKDTSSVDILTEIVLNCDKKDPSRDSLPNTAIDGPIEAKWDEQGAICMSHSRLWMRDSVVLGFKYSTDLSLEANESKFVSQFELPLCKNDHQGIFTTYALHHIRDY